MGCFASRAVFCYKKVMKITIIDQGSNTIHEVAEAPEKKLDENAFSWFDPDDILAATKQFLFTEDDTNMTSSRIRFTDGREIEVDCKTGDLVGV